MKRLLIIIMLFISIGAQGQSIIDHLGKIRMRYNNAGSNDTLLIQFSGDSTYYFSNSNPFHKFNGGIIAGALKLNNGAWITSLVPSQWTTSGLNIYYNTGNVGINNASPSYKLDVGGIIGGNNIETNLISQTTRLGHQSGNSEDEGSARYNTFIGYKSGYTNTTGINNIFIGFNAGYTNETGFFNTYIGNYSGYSTTGTRNTFIGLNSGRTFTSGYNNTVVGFNAGNGTTGTSYGNVFLGYSAGEYETGNEKLYIDNQDRTSEALARSGALLYGEFSNTVANQRLTVNGLLTAHNLETNTTSLSTKLGYEAGFNEIKTSARFNVFNGYQAGYSLTAGTNNTISGAYAGYSLLSGQNNTFIGNSAGTSTTTGSNNVFLGMIAGNDNIYGINNTYIGFSAGSGNTDGDNNVIIGYQAGIDETGSNKLIIDNQDRTSEALTRSGALLYGEFAADPLDQTLTFNAKTNLHAHSALFGRNAAYNITSTNTWLTLKMDTMCAPVTSSGFEFNADSTGVKVLFNGFIEVSGHAKLLNNAASQQTANIYVRLRKNNVEITQFNTAVGRTFNANGAHDLVSVTGFIPVSVNDVISVQCRTDNANIDLEQTDGGVFDGSSSFCIFLKEMKFVKTFE